MSREELEKQFTEVHDELTRLYYQERTISMEEFNKLHTAGWLHLEKERIARGFQEDFDVSEKTPDGEVIVAKTRSQEIAASLPETADEDWTKHGVKSPAEIKASIV